MTIPNFLVIGTQRSASTWLFNCLKEHPDVFVPENKDLEFFCNNKNYERGISYYSSFFDKANGYKAIGEISPDCLANESCPERIFLHLPDVKIIVILRNPIERAFSAYRKFIFPQTGWSFEEAIERRPILLEYGLYYKQLQRYFTKFSRIQFQIFLYEDLVRSNLDVVNAVYKFLGVDSTITPSWIGRSSNVSSFPRLKKIINKYQLTWTLDLIKVLRIDIIHRILQQKRKQKRGYKIKTKTRSKLVDYYRESNNNLSKLLDIDLSSWK